MDNSTNQSECTRGEVTSPISLRFRDLESHIEILNSKIKALEKSLTPILGSELPIKDEEDCIENGCEIEGRIYRSYKGLDRIITHLDNIMCRIRM